MFESAIEKAANFTRAIHTILRTYGSQIIHPGAATLFFVNADGWALTCRHVAELIAAASNINSIYNEFKTETQRLVSSGKKEKLAKRDMQKKFDFQDGTTIQIKHSFVDCVTGNLNLELRVHGAADLALIHFKDCQLQVSDFPIFPQDVESFKSGKFLCRLGYPFPEFNNFEYSKADDDIKWTVNGLYTCD